MYLRRLRARDTFAAADVAWALLAARCREHADARPAPVRLRLPVIHDLAASRCTPRRVWPPRRDDGPQPPHAYQQE